MALLWWLWEYGGDGEGDGSASEGSDCWEEAALLDPLLPPCCAEGKKELNAVWECYFFVHVCSCCILACVCVFSFLCI